MYNNRQIQKFTTEPNKNVWWFNPETNQLKRHGSNGWEIVGADPESILKQCECTPIEEETINDIYKNTFNH